MIALVHTLVLLVQVAPPPPANGSPQARFDEATRVYDSGRYADAAELFRQLIEETGQPALQLPYAHSLRLAGRCPAALAAYQRFLDAEPTLTKKAESAGAGSGMKRLPNDLLVARARVVEMRVCASRGRSEPARQAAVRRLAAGDPDEAIAVLQQIWDEGKDPTLLVEMAEIQRERGKCEDATRFLNLSIAELAPVEPLANESPGADAAFAFESLRRARAAKLEFRCTPPAPAPQKPPAAGITVAQALLAPAAQEVRLDQSVSAGARPRWPVYTAIAGGVLAAAGVGSWVMMQKTKSDIEQVKRDRRLDDAEIRTMVNRGERYQIAGSVLVASGVSTAAASLIYWYLSGARGGATAMAHVGAGGATLAIGGRF